MVIFGKLLPNNRYDEARGNRKSAYQGSYKVTGNHIDYKDDTGFTADGEFRDGVLYHGGMIFYLLLYKLIFLRKIRNRTHTIYCIG
ncbi:Atu4866 domain-containing protein [Olivibacter sp. SDN3]|uniref:Atu4866 domain-containing protein n=1 Tax=Olivibacter sp. SDN3 TaxID=2764720 RepID=UPI001C9E75DF